MVVHHKTVLKRKIELKTCCCQNEWGRGNITTFIQRRRQNQKSKVPCSCFNLCCSGRLAGPAAVTFANRVFRIRLSLILVFLQFCSWEMFVLLIFRTYWSEWECVAEPFSYSFTTSVHLRTFEPFSVCLCVTSCLVGSVSISTVSHLHAGEDLMSLHHSYIGSRYFFFRRTWTNRKQPQRCWLYCVDLCQTGLVLTLVVGFVVLVCFCVEVAALLMIDLTLLHFLNSFKPFTPTL